MYKMWRKSNRDIERVRQFFIVGLSHDNLENYYRVNFTMMFDYNKDLNFFDNAIPFEKDIYLDMLIARLRNSGSQTNTYNDTSLPRKEEFEK